MKIIRKELTAREVVNTSLRYDPDTDTVQTTPDGGVTWVDTPGSDPRTAPQFKLPPVVSDDPKCQAASNFEASINNALQQMGVILGAATTAEGMLTVVITAVGVFIPGAGSIGALAFLALDAATVLFDAGLVAVQAAFSPTNLGIIKCAYLAHCEIDGTMTADDLSAFLDVVGSSPGGLSATVLNALFTFGGVNLASNMAATGMAAADCAACPTPPYIEAFDTELNFGTIIGGDPVYNNNYGPVPFGELVASSVCHDAGQGHGIGGVQSVNGASWGDSGENIGHVTFDFGRATTYTVFDFEEYLSSGTKIYTWTAWDAHGNIIGNHPTGLVGGGGACQQNDGVSMPEGTRWFAFTMITGAESTQQMTYFKFAT